MRAITISFCGTLVVGLCAVAVGQVERRAAPRVERGAAPTDQAAFFMASDLRADVKMQLAKKMSNSIGLMEGGHFSLNLVHREGTEPPQWHAEEVDLYIVVDGTATQITGGELAGDVQTAADGDKRATSIRGGVSRVIGPGDVVFIPPGVPHQGVFNSPGGITYLNVHFPGRWPPKHQ